MYTYNVNTCNALIIIAFPNKSIFYSNKQNFQKFYKSCANSSKPQGSTYSYILVYNIGYHNYLSFFEQSHLVKISNTVSWRLESNVVVPQYVSVLGSRTVVTV